ncbi:MAG: hypothetical protein H7Y01_15385 [Ferruginibacter sp.]|nr:hypothetical protein [Chitinophagaceae bacterium]
MDRKTLTLVLGVALLGGFFLPYWVGASGFDYVSAKGAGWEQYLLLLIPLSGLLLIFGALNNNYILGRGLLSWLPFLTLIFVLIVNPLIKGMAIGDIFKAIGRGYGAGLWITLIAAIILAFYNPRER